MPLDHTTTLFFDASCLIAAAGSPAGGSSYLLSLCERGFLAGAVSHQVLRETVRNISMKLPPQALRRFNYFRTHIPLTLMGVTGAATEPYAGFVNAKDVHVIAAAMSASAKFLLTLDAALAREVNQAGLSIRALSPGEFIKSILPRHPDYTRLRT